MRSVLRNLAMLAFVIFVFNSAQAYVTVSGNVSGQYWHNTDTYYVSGDLTVDDGTTLEIQAGTRVKFAPGTRLTVFGTLIANGNSTSNIFFTSRDDDNVGEIIAGSDGNPNPGDWEYIQISGQGDNDGIATFNYCHARYGGSGGNGNIYFYYADSPYFTNSSGAYSSNHGVRITSSTVYFEGSDFANNNSHGIYASSGEVHIDNCLFTNNGSYAANLLNVTVIPYTGNTGSGNQYNAFGISGNIEQNITLSESLCGFPYVIIGEITLAKNYILTIPAGEVIKANNGWIVSYGTVSAIGTSAEPIVFTSLLDDTYGGDLNGDGNATTPSPGNWSGIYVSGQNDNEGIGWFDHCRVRYGGSSSNEYASVYFYYPDDGYFKNGVVEYSQYSGVYARSANLDASNNQLLNNGSHGWRTMNSNLNLDNGIFNNNGDHGILANNDTLQISNCQFNNNGTYAAYLNNVNVKTYANNSGSGNTINAFGISGLIEQNLSLSESVCGFPYVIIGQLNLADNYTLTIPAGEVIKAISSNALIYANGTVNAIGTVANPIVFTSLYDDTYGGDLNGDGDATTPAPGDWGGLTMYGQNDNEGIGWFDHCQVRYGGSSSNEYSSVYLYYPDDGYFKNTVVEHSQYSGVYARSANLDASNNQLLNNGSHGWRSQNSNLNLDNGIFNNNGDHGIFANSDTLQISNCQFNNNGIYAANLNNVNVKTYTNNTGSGNTINAFGISGIIEQNLTLSESVCGFPYVLNGNLTLNDGFQLTIPAGEVIKGVGVNALIYNYGTVNAIGTIADPIVFTSLYDDTYGGDLNGDGDATAPAPGDWGGLTMYGQNDYDGIGWFDHCQVRYGGSSSNEYSSVYLYFPDDGYFKNAVVEYGQYSGVRTRNANLDASNNQLLNNGSHGWRSQNSNLNLDNGIFNNNGDHGIFANSDTLQISNCQFNNNGIYAANLNNVNVKTYTNNTGSGNTINAFGISGIIEQNLSLSESVCGFPYVLIGELTLADDYTMTIPAGEVIKGMGVNALIYNYGTVNAIGTVADPIVFTSLYDDTYGGDLNGDGDATAPAPGNWGGLTLYGASNYNGIGWFDHCLVRFAGASGNDHAAIYLYQADTAGVNHCTIESSINHGLRINSSGLTIRNSTIQNNLGFGIYNTGYKVLDLGNNSLADAGLNTFINNNEGVYQLYNASALDINAYYNDWGFYTQTEIDAHIYDDNENASYGEVHFNPWYDPSNPPLEVNFAADTLNGQAPFTVQFYDSTLLTPTSWEWDFENDGIVDATDQNPVWIYQDPGVYSIKLEVSNGTTSDSLIKTDYITVTASSYALQFDGIDDFVKTGGVPFPSDDLTIEAWIYPTNLTAFQEIVFFYSAYDGVQFRLQSDGSLIYLESAGGGYGYVLSPSDRIRTNEWAHVAITKEGDLCTLYINGLPAGYNHFDRNPVPDTISIGGRSKYMDRFFEGNIDEVRIWNIARTQSEIQASMSSYLDGPETGLFVYYQLNEGTGQMVNDLSTNGYDGRLGLTDGEDDSDPAWLATTWPYPITERYAIDVKAFFEGPFNGIDMNADLNVTLPLDQPYNVYPWEYNQGESVPFIPNGDIVDWILVEYRDAADINLATSDASIGGQAGFILKDGSIVDLNGSSPLQFDYSINENLFVVLWHRNHLPVISNYPLLESGGVYSYNFTNYASQAYGDNQSNLGGIFGLIGGDANADGTINENDGIELWYPFAGQAGYFGGDVNMDTQVNNMDKNDTWFSNNGKSEMLPSDGFSSCGDVLFDDRNGQSYNTVLIDDQCWMAQNLNVGTRIDGIMDQSNNSTIEKYCYDNQETNCDTYGGLYQWSEMMGYTSTSGAQGICPDSWHVATNAELVALVTFVNEDGNALKAIGQGTGEGTGTNTSGFSAMLSGNRDPGGPGFEDINNITTFWSSTHQVTSWAYRTTLNSSTGLIQGGVSHITFGNPVRCVKD